MSENCGIRVYTECESGYVSTVTGPFYGDRPTFLFSVTFGSNNTTQNGRIYWDYVNTQWVVEDQDLGQPVSVLPYDRPYPYGTFNEWTTVGFGAACFTAYQGAFFNTEYVNFGCPPTYLQFCCQSNVQSENFFGITNFEYQGYLNNVFYLETPQFSGCATVIEGPIPSNSIVYGSVTTITQYNRCNDCTGSTFSCNNQPIYTTPTPVPIVTANTACGNSQVLVNECSPLSIPLMSVECVVTNITEYGGNDGIIELVITGGTSPYNILWSNGNTGYVLYNLSVGEYSYTVTDYYGDYVISSSCRVQQPPVPTPPAPYPNICMTIQVEDEVARVTLQAIQPTNGGRPGYAGEGYELIWNDNTNPTFWSMEGPLTLGDMVNYNSDYVPLTGWTWLIQNSVGSAEGTIGDCQNYGDFCMTLNVNSFATQPYRIQFQQNSDINGQPSWTDTTGVYDIVYTPSQTNNPAYWSLVGLPNYFNGQIVNNNTVLPPLNGWTVQGTDGNVVTLDGSCFSEVICASFKTDCGDETIEMYSGETINGNPTWYGILPCGDEGSFFIFWDDSINYWSTSGLSLSSYLIVEAIRFNNSYTGPFGPYYVDGDYELTVSEGQCNQPGRALIITTTTNEPITGSDGGIVIDVEGGVGPYEYSVDNGTTYRSLPIFYGLKSGIYAISVKDSNGVITKKSLTLKVPQRKTVYQVSLNTTSKRTSNTSTVTTTEYTTKVVVVPELPSGTTITFDIVLTDNYNVSPYDYAANLTLGSMMLKNEGEISYNSVESVSYNEVNTTIGCQNYNKFITATTFNWQNITMGYGDNIVITTTVSVQRNGKYPCYSAINTEINSLFNLSIIGCSNCEVSNQQGLPPISPTPSTTPSATPTTTTTGTALT
jgi:hypothetical protein